MVAVNYIFKSLVRVSVLIFALIVDQAIAATVATGTYSFAGASMDIGMPRRGTKRYSPDNDSHFGPRKRFCIPGDAPLRADEVEAMAMRMEADAAEAIAMKAAGVSQIVTAMAAMAMEDTGVEAKAMGAAGTSPIVTAMAAMDIDMSDDSAATESPKPLRYTLLGEKFDPSELVVSEPLKTCWDEAISDCSQPSEGCAIEIDLPFIVNLSAIVHRCEYPAEIWHPIFNVWLHKVYLNYGAIASRAKHGKNLQITPVGSFYGDNLQIQYAVAITLYRYIYQYRLGEPISEVAGPHFALDGLSPEIKTFYLVTINQKNPKVIDMSYGDGSFGAWVQLVKSEAGRIMEMQVETLCFGKLIMEIPGDGCLDGARFQVWEFLRK